MVKRKKFYISLFSILLISFVFIFLNQNCGRPLTMKTTDLNSLNGIIKKNILVSWTSPSTNIDGSDLLDLSGFKIYYGTSPGVYDKNIDVGNVNSFVIKEAPGIYYIAVVAYNFEGSTSVYSDEVVLTVH